MRLTPYQTIDSHGELRHSGHRYQDLAQMYGTPLYIFDEALFKANARAYQLAMAHPNFDTEVLYASKALLTKAVAQLVAELGLGQDVVSAGEIYTAIAGGVPAHKLYFHGNNKQNTELTYALEQGVGTIVIDNRSEASRLAQIASQLGKTQRVLLRLNPGVEAHTHEYIQTASLDSKFGESIYDPAIYQVIQDLAASDYLELAGFHSHIGSQVFEASSFLKAASAMLEFTAQAQRETGLVFEELNFGGGYGTYYVEGDQDFDVVHFLPAFMTHINQENQRLGLQLKKIAIESGRSLVNSAGSTLYRVGDIKETLSGKQYLFVDGGMSDNIRPALYQAAYEAILTNKADQANTQTYTIAGKLCESGDKLIEAIQLPPAITGDLLLVNGTGAYTYTMASNYNRLPKPAMIHIDGDQHRLTVKRETFADMLQHEL